MVAAEVSSQNEYKNGRDKDLDQKKFSPSLVMKGEKKSFIPGRIRSEVVRLEVFLENR